MQNDAAEIESSLETLAVENQDAGLTFEFVSSLLESRYPGIDAPVLKVGGGDGSVLAILPMLSSSRQIRGVQFAQLDTLLSTYSTQGKIPVSTNKTKLAIATALDYLLSQPGWDFFEIVVPDNSKFRDALDDAIRSMDLPFVSRAHDPTPTILMDETLDQVLAEKSANFRMNLRRKSRKAEKAGKIEFDIVETPERTDQAMSEIFNIEAKSWKANTDSMIQSDDARREFYSLLANRSASKSRLLIYLMRLNGVPIAYDYGLFFQDRYLMLKTSFDEDYKNLSPGVNLRHYVLQDLETRGCVEHNFLWGDEQYKKQWANHTRQFLTYTLFNRSVKGRLLNVYQVLSKALRPKAREA